MNSSLESKIAAGRGRHIRRNVLSSYAGQTVSILTPLILIPLYTRWLGHATYGQWLMIQSVAVYLGLGSLGTWQSVGNRITEGVATGRRDELGQVISTAFVGYAIVAAILALVCGVAAPWIFAGVASEGDSHVAIAFVVLAGLLLSSWPLRTSAMVLRGFERVDREQSVAVVAALLRMIGTATVLYAGLRLIAVALVQGGALLCYGLGAYLLSLRLTPQARPRLSRFSTAVLRSLAMPSLSFFVMDASHTLSFSVDNLVIGYVVGTAMVTAYSVPYRMLLMSGAMFTVLLSALRPTLTTRFVRGERDLLYSGLILLLRLAFLYATFVAFLAWLLGPEILRLWAGAGVFPGKTAFGMQIAVFMMGVVIEPALAILMATTHHYGYAKMALVEGLLNLGLSLWWVHYWGLAGVIGGTLSARVIISLWYAPWAALTLLEARFSQVLKDLGPAALICVVTICAGIIVDRMAHGNLALLVISAAVGGVTILTLFTLIVFSSSERRTAWQLLTRSVNSAALQNELPADAGSGR